MGVVPLTVPMETGKLSDAELMVRLAGGDERAFETLVNRHLRRILNLIHHFIGDRNQAEDVAQEVFIRVWRAAKTYKPHAKFTTWIYRVAANLCLDDLKSAYNKQKFVHRADQDEDAGESEGYLPVSGSPASPEDALLASEERTRISAALRSLPTNQRMAVILCKFDGLSYEEISKVLGCSVSAVESLIVRGKKNLREKLMAADRIPGLQSFISEPHPNPDW